MTSVLFGYALPLVHVLACLFLIVVVLLQTGKGADMGAVLGGGSQTLFGASGAGNLLTKLTTGMAITFMATSLLIAIGQRQQPSSTLIDRLPEAPPAAAPIDVPPPAAPTAEAPAAGTPTAAAPAAAPAPGGAPAPATATPGAPNSNLLVTTEVVPNPPAAAPAPADAKPSAAAPAQAPAAAAPTPTPTPPAAPAPAAP